MAKTRELEQQILMVSNKAPLRPSVKGAVHTYSHL